MKTYPLCTEATAVATFTETLNNALNRAVASIENKRASISKSHTASLVEILENLKNQNDNA